MTIKSVGGIVLLPSTQDQNPKDPNLDFNVLVRGEPNLVAGNIKSGVGIFGVNGNMQPKQYASGTVTCASTLTVTGLSFTPAVIVIEYSGGRKVYNPNRLLDCDAYIYGANASNNNFYGDFTVSAGQFSSPVPSSSITYNWWTWG